MQQTKYQQIIFFLGIVLIILGLCLPWFVGGDFVTIYRPPLVFNWTTTFPEAGGRIHLPSLEQNIASGYLLLLGVSYLIFVWLKRLSSQYISSTTLGVALFFLSISIYYLISIWGSYIKGGIIGLSPPGFGLYVFFMGALILFTISLLSVRRNKH